MTIIQLHLPDDLAGKMLRLTGNAEEFIIDLLRKKVAMPGNGATLAEEYKMASKENAQLPEDFKGVDLEAWADEY